METSLGAVARTASFCDSTPKEQSNSSSVDGSNSPGEWPSDADGCIELHNIRAKYTNSSPTWTLRDITISIPSGAKIAICGSTGSGKSSLLLSLLSMIEVAQGRTLVGGSDLSQFPGSIIRDHLVVIPQDGFILGATLREGLDPSGENQSTSDAEIEDVLQKCNMWSRVESIGGLNAPLNTENFSAGEGQLFYLARAILKARQGKSKVVLMDEATSSLDAETDSKVHELAQTEFSTLTVLSVLHRLETAVQYDHILVLDKGGVTAWGSPDEVIAQCDLF